MQDEIKSPLKAIRAYCIDCCGGSSSEVKICGITKCVLHPFRFGKNPYRHNSREYTDDEKAAIAERLKNARQNT